MTETFILLISITLAGSILFGLSLVFEHLFADEYIDYKYYIMKLVLVYFLFPIVAAIYFVITLNRHTVLQTVKTEDFHSIKQTIGSKELGAIGNTTDFLLLITVIWLTIFIVLFIFSFVRSRLYIRSLVKTSVRISDNRIHMLSELKKEFHITKDLKICENHLVTNPFLTGIFNPLIILPSSNYNTDEWEMILRHEIIHYKNHDLLFRIALDFVQKMHWFNPIIYLFTLKFYEMSELVCDKKVITLYKKEQRVKYAKLLSKVSCESYSMRISISFSNSYKRIERRVVGIMNYKKQKISIGIIISIALFISICPLSTYAAATFTTNTENYIVEQYRFASDNRSSKIKLDDEIIVDKVNQIDANEIPSKSSRGDNSIKNYRLKSNGEALFSSVSLYNGSKVIIGVSSTNSKDSYIGGIIDEDGNRYYVSSSNGVLGQTFEVKDAGEYIVFFEGKNGSKGSDIYLSGTITVKY